MALKAKENEFYRDEQIERRQEQVHINVERRINQN